MLTPLSQKQTDELQTHLNNAIEEINKRDIMSGQSSLSYMLKSLFALVKSEFKKIIPEIAAKYLYQENQRIKESQLKSPTNTTLQPTYS